MKIQKASRKGQPIKLTIEGISGSGKTYSALQLAFGITGDWKKIVVIDTEEGTGNYYSDFGEYNVLPLPKPHTPETYIEAISLCEQSGYKLIIIDSVTHEWKQLLADKEGLEASKSSNANGYTAWGEITPRHDAFITKIISSPCHIIATMRSKNDIVMTPRENRSGKVVVVPIKVGMAPIQRKGFEYEFSISFQINADHKATTIKDRTRIFGKELFQITPETGEKILNWINEGDAPSRVLQSTIPRTRKQAQKLLNKGKWIEVKTIEDYHKFQENIESKIYEWLYNEYIFEDGIILFAVKNICYAGKLIPGDLTKFKEKFFPEKEAETVQKE